MRFPIILVPGSERALSHTSQDLRFLCFSSHLPYNGHFLHVRGCVLCVGIDQNGIRNSKEPVKLNTAICGVFYCLITFNESTKMMQQCGCLS